MSTVQDGATEYTIDLVAIARGPAVREGMTTCPGCGLVLATRETRGALYLCPSCYRAVQLTRGAWERYGRELRAWQDYERMRQTMRRDLPARFKPVPPDVAVVRVRVW